MKIGLHAIDSTIPNLALMKISEWHKQQGDKTELFNPLWNYDKVYVSKIFSYSKPPQEIYPPNTEYGGSGYNLETFLPDHMEHLMPDYDLFPGKNYSMGFTTRGCLRRCKFCIVPKKEGRIHAVADIYEFWNKRHKELVLLDNNIFGIEGHFEKISEQILKEGLKVDFNQGLDIRLLTDEKAKLLKKLKPINRWRFAFDSIKQENAFRRGAEILMRNKISKGNISIYTLVGFGESYEDTLKRVTIISEEYKFGVYIMPYQSDNKSIPEGSGIDEKLKNLIRTWGTPSWVRPEVMAILAEHERQRTIDLWNG